MANVLTGLTPVTMLRHRHRADNHPAQEIVEDLEAALAQFLAVAIRLAFVELFRYRSYDGFFILEPVNRTTGAVELPMGN